ncbi:hypothetical protein LZ554_004165 [Drepanopeziza brunnea f. sp. 'monogermtubi']|nr:hypothetical protein LZ554_004165 [Drepanopeziza brunnea f. sp. 'monogermtubi']
MTAWVVLGTSVCRKLKMRFRNSEIAFEIPFGNQALDERPLSTWNGARKSYQTGPKTTTAVSYSGRLAPSMIHSNTRPGTRIPRKQRYLGRFVN